MLCHQLIVKVMEENIVILLRQVCDPRAFQRVCDRNKSARVAARRVLVHRSRVNDLPGYALAGLRNSHFQVARCEINIHILTIVAPERER